MSLIRTEYIRPPIPTTQFDWMAWIDGEPDVDDNGPTGYGPTEAEALRDLCEALALLYLEDNRLTLEAQNEVARKRWEMNREAEREMRAARETTE